MIDHTSVLIATPVKDYKPDLAYLQSVLLLSQVYTPLPAFMFLPGDSDVRHARNKLTNAFLNNTNLPWICMIDDDMGYTPEDFKMLLAAEGTAICGLYAKKQHDSAPSHGLGFCRIAREVFLKLSSHYSVTSYQDEDGQSLQDFFGYCISNGQWVSESIGFWRRLSDIGIQHNNIIPPNLIHYGRTGFKLDLRSIQV